jgi:hypothetical protein
MDVDELVVNKTKNYSWLRVLDSSPSHAIKSQFVINILESSWVSIYAFMVEDWQRTLLLKQVVDGIIWNNMKWILMNVMVVIG